MKSQCVLWSTAKRQEIPETADSLKEFLHWFKGRKCSPRLSAISNLNMPKNSGQKGGTRRRKGASNKSSTEGRPTVCSRVLQPSNNAVANVPASHVVPDHSPAWQSHPIHVQMQPSINLGNAENSPFTYNHCSHIALFSWSGPRCTRKHAGVLSSMP